ncbi:hypothetical protein C8A00DRAFT_46791 [Chaetomidium leptoderma]|uniref:Uncharacterized protein n=1 Tax=Chaetomidium leptoderma TaxID=669021 RepID=A0AAN6ZTL3_9PEZI|nr:hypothetical protein C8A00DRAFT_46791 [Chaetomidium leptoderma]
MDTASAPADSGEHGAIQVAPSEYYEPGAVMEPYFGPDGSPHAVSQASLMEPPVSSQTVRVRCIDSWEELWADQHWGCDADPSPLYPNWRRRGPRPDDETFEPTIYLLECCGQKRPWAYDTYLQVAAQVEFLTVHEFVSAVHPWLMAMRDTLLDVLGKLNGHPPWPPETKLAVLDLWPGSLRIDHEDKWARCHRRPPVPRPATEQLSAEERSRKAMERVMTMAAVKERAREEEARAAEMDKEIDSNISANRI